MLAAWCVRISHECSETGTAQLPVDWYESNFVKRNSMLFRMLDVVDVSTLEKKDLIILAGKSKAKYRIVSNSISKAVRSGMLETLGKKVLRATPKGLALFEAARLDITPRSLLLLVHIKNMMQDIGQYHRSHVMFGQMYNTHVNELTFNKIIFDLLHKGLLTRMSNSEWHVSNRIKPKTTDMIMSWMVRQTGDAAVL